MFKKHLEDCVLDAEQRYETENRSVNTVTPHPRDRARDITELVYTGLIRRGYTEQQLSEFLPTGRAMGAAGGFGGSAPVAETGGTKDDNWQ